ncbi:conserved protein of unknown function [Sterolibacterium denitrificans]|uniref:Uncharacterized protein n=2 Tax=Sterolibacterium denitrificans TaxID=157592 RepID=A0A656Z8X5_9PROT|nr:DUF721 domain-containing protein [Sterolibacterium denitrificans]KYC29427.1 hypothetical protein ACY05_02645 [Sterolibacterium denitrificans]SMB31453.1 conserved protein of unknown function [Sterolibacterium denitrificans]
MRSRPLDDYLRTDAAIANLQAHADHLLQLQQILAASLPPALARSCRVANLKQGVLIIHAENGAAATKLRQLTTTLTERYRAHGEPLTEVRIKVQPLDEHPQPKPPPRAATLGSGGRASIERLLGSLPDGPLRQALTGFVNTATTKKP